MPLTVSTGVQKKVGTANYGSVGASCSVTFEADHALLDTDLDGFHEKVKRAFVAARQAVCDQLARELNADTNGQAATSNGATSNSPARSNATSANAQRRTVRKATASQVRALNAIASRQAFVLAETLQESYGVSRLEDLSITEASQLIDTLKAASSHISYSAA